MIPDTIPMENRHRNCGELHMEIMDARDSSVWQMMGGVSREEYDTLEVEEPYVKIGVGLSAFDASYFKRSPDVETDGPMRSRDLFGYTWHFCARPLGARELPEGQEGPVQMSIDKHHVLYYEAGRTLKYLILPDGTEYVHVVRGKQEPKLPEGWTIREEQLEQERSVELPNPTRVFFFPGGGGSYQGPL